MPIYAITMLTAGIGIPILAAMNAGLGPLPWGVPTCSWLSHITGGGYDHRARCYCKASIQTAVFTFGRNFSCVLCIINDGHCTKVQRW